MLDDDTLAALTALAGRLADAAGAAALPWFRAPGLETGNKAGAGAFDPVTAADRAAEEAARAILARERPEDAVLGEEGERTAGTSGLTWVIDPIDGTRSFIAGLPTWGVLIALDDGRATRLGIVDQPYIGERFGARLGPSGADAWLARGGARRALRVRPCATLGDAVLLSTAPEMFAPPELVGFSAVSRRCRLTRYGTDCYGYAMVAAGHA
ncbi:MAG TPA: inositol monophosphatase family protein, partial [Thermohalobaculum sp.]|nr:inositol monophosphatase family protein [Thermohalobaculum sp.]